MIPIGDVNPRRHFPAVTLAIVVVNVLAFLYQLTLPDVALERFILTAGAVPYRITHDFGLPAAFTMFTSMFLHGGWTHILGNMLYLWIFGDNVEEHLGRLNYLIFYLGAGLAALVAQIAVSPSSTVPTIGASGAIAGVLGAYAVLFPRARVRTVILVVFIRLITLPALVVLGFWFVLQLFNGLASVTAMSSGGVAWFAHIGGFVAGMLVGAIAKGKRPRTWSAGY